MICGPGAHVAEILRKFEKTRIKHIVDIKGKECREAGGQGTVS